MNVSEEAVVLGSRTTSGVHCVQHPRVLFMAPEAGNGEGSAQKARALAGNLASDGWTVYSETGEMSTSGRNSCRSRHSLFQLSWLRRFIRSFPKYDVIHFIADTPASFWLFAAPAMAMAKFFGKKAVLSFAPVTSEVFLDRWAWLAHPVFRMADRLLVDSEYLVRVFARSGLQVDCIAIPFDLSGLEYHEAAAMQPVILVDRSLEKVNNVACLIRAFKFVKQKYPRSELMIVGDGHQRRALEYLVSSGNIHGVTFLGNVGRNDKAALYRQADIYVNSSSVDGTPESILRALVTGLPVVTTDAGGIPHLVSDRVNGLVVAVNNHVAMAERIIELVENPDLAKVLVERGRADSERFHWRSIGSSWRQYYQSLVSS